VGRQREMLEVERELEMTRLLTLTGAGGSGKTRLALEVARDLVGTYADGVWLVEFAPLTEEALVLKAVAEALEVPERPQEPLAQTLTEVLADKELLLVLDNCEHLLEATARQVDVLLDSCPRLGILATSREALEVEGELRWPVPPLSAPDPERSLTVEELESSESARLFLARARGHDPSFAFTAQNARAMGEICTKLEGIPLAIELAAARVGTLSGADIEEARRLPRVLDTRRPYDNAPPADAERSSRLEPRTAPRAGKDPVREALRVRWRVDAGGRGGRGVWRGHRGA
jgi:predicted ATPase